MALTAAVISAFQRLGQGCSQVTPCPTISWGLQKVSWLAEQLTTLTVHHFGKRFLNQVFELGNAQFVRLCFAPNRLTCKSCCSIEALTDKFACIQVRLIPRARLRDSIQPYLDFAAFEQRHEIAHGSILDYPR